MRDLIVLVNDQEEDYNSYGPWEQFIPGRGAYKNGRYVSYDGNVTLPNGEKVTHVEHWNSFDEGEVWHSVVEFRGALYELVINNDSWNDGGIDLSSIYPVEAHEVTKTEYVRV